MASGETLIFLLIQFHLSFSIDCGSLTILCNTGDPSCYQGPCADMAHYFVNINKFTATPPSPPQLIPLPSPSTPLPTNPITIPSPSTTITQPNPSTSTPEPFSCPGNQQVNPQGFCQCLPQAADGGWFPLCNPPLLKDPIWCDCIPHYYPILTQRPTSPPSIATPQPTTPQPTPAPILITTAQPTTTSIPEPEPQEEEEEGGSSSSSSSDEEEGEEEQANPEPTEPETTTTSTTTTSTTTSTTEATLICPIPGDACTNELPRAERCCDGQIGGRNKCKYNAIDNNGFRTGYCCVKRNRDGCLRDADCCNTKDSCINGWCKVPSTNGASVNNKIIDIEPPSTETHIVDVYNEKDNDHHKKSEKLHNVFFTTGTAFVILCIFVLPIMYYWYFKIYWLSKLKYVRTRPRSSTIYDHDPSDYTDRESDWIPSDDSDLP